VSGRLALWDPSHQELTIRSDISIFFEISEAEYPELPQSQLNTSGAMVTSGDERDIILYKRFYYILLKDTRS
jgi:hypothetical protein